MPTASVVLGLVLIAAPAAYCTGDDWVGGQ
jgi:hypothetical protein